MPYHVCTVCDRPGRFEDAQDVQRIHSNVRQFQSEAFTVWRCANCGALHCLEDIDYDHYYRDYPLRRQKPDFFTRRLFSARLRQLTDNGLEKGHAILDYGCGNGGFVEFLQQRGYHRAVGYDPYCERFADRSLLQRTFDVLVSQDVLEHAPDPVAMLVEMLETVDLGGTIVIGTPDAAGIRLGDPVDAAGQLHQPYHRHLLTQAQLTRMIEAHGFTVIRSLSRWYVDTWIPFLNSKFFFNYVLATGGAVDSSFEPIRFDLIFRSPRLLLFGLLGRLWDPRKDMVIFAKRTQHKEIPRNP